jgi:aryl-alcohol dehydrogenase-like predicted oxidoreductase
MQFVAAASLMPLLGTAAAGEPAPQPGANPAPPAPPAPAALPKEGERVPRRKLGKTGVEVSCLAFGITARPKPEVFDRALKWGIDHWDTAASYAGAEAAIGAYLKANKGLREKLFLSTKPADITTPEPVYADMEASLDKSLATIGIEHIDFFLGIHACPRPTCITDEFLRFGEDMKKKGKIRFFGFSNHASTSDNLAKAAPLPGIDAILVAYNFRQTASQKLRASMEACVKAGIGLIAIKGQGFGVRQLNEKDEALLAAFRGRGFNEAQAKAKLVLEEPLITSLAVGMKTVEVVDSSAGAAILKEKLSALDRQALEAFAFSSACSYCAGCVQHCGGPGMARSAVADVMRCHMYDRVYDDRAFAEQAFALIPAEGKEYLRRGDLAAAERLCPHQLPIESMVDEALARFGRAPSIT